MPSSSSSRPRASMPAFAQPEAREEQQKENHRPHGSGTSKKRAKSLGGGPSPNKAARKSVIPGRSILKPRPSSNTGQYDEDLTSSYNPRMFSKSSNVISYAEMQRQADQERLQRNAQLAVANAQQAKGMSLARRVSFAANADIRTIEANSDMSLASTASVASPPHTQSASAAPISRDAESESEASMDISNGSDLPALNARLNARRPSEIYSSASATATPSRKYQIPENLRPTAAPYVSAIPPRPTFGSANVFALDTSIDMSMASAEGNLMDESMIMPDENMTAAFDATTHNRATRLTTSTPTANVLNRLAQSQAPAPSPGDQEQDMSLATATDDTSVSHNSATSGEVSMDLADDHQTAAFDYHMRNRLGTDYQAPIADVSTSTAGRSSRHSQINVAVHEDSDRTVEMSMSSSHAPSPLPSAQNRGAASLAFLDDADETQAYADLSDAESTADMELTTAYGRIRNRESLLPRPARPSLAIGARPTSTEVQHRIFQQHQARASLASSPRRTIQKTGITPLPSPRRVASPLKTISTPRASLTPLRASQSASTPVAAQATLAVNQTPTPMRVPQQGNQLQRTPSRSQDVFSAPSSAIRPLGYARTTPTKASAAPVEARRQSQVTMPPASPSRRRSMAGDVDLVSASETVPVDVQEEQQPVLTVDDFFEITGVQFMSDMIVPASRKSAASPNRPRESFGSSLLAEQIKAAASSVFFLDTYKHMVMKLGEQLKENRAAREEIDEVIELSQPRIFSEWLRADDDKRAAIESELKLVKTWCRLDVRSDWYSFRTQLFLQVCDSLQINLAQLRQDQAQVASWGANVTELLPDLRSEYGRLKEELVREQARQRELDASDKDELHSLHLAIAEQGAALEEIQKDHAEVQGQLERLESKSADIDAEMSHMESTIAKSTSYCDRVRRFTQTEVRRLKDDYEALERITGCKIVGLRSGQIKLCLCDELQVTLDISSKGVIKRKHVYWLRAPLQEEQYKRAQTSDALQDRPDQLLAATRFLFDRLRLAIEADTETRPYALIRQIVLMWTAARRLIEELRLLQSRFPIKVMALKKPSRGNAPYLRTTTTVFSQQNPAGPASLRVAFEMTGEEITTGDADHAVESISTTVDAVFGSVDVKELQYRVLERVTSGGSRALLEACMELE
ncbi:hypothetical protein E5Q_06243 [Mixia osmundae IAM 14324]|uniref:Spc7 kinetochore protein domain-containing protein n=1 Tax=Mixia osmundae (strain CBS 9802 / IAM 14324 / JCM 22182 / KY 12970) TaxID=764103 RepID=G7E8S4_MIXOS|nr:hypothetical protein E5Q_06243 [Mixia osmundae IAM 14324]